jgi:hypothetical protein
LKTVQTHIKIDSDFIDKADPFEIIDPAWWTVNIYAGELAYVESLARFSAGQRMLHAIAWYWAEVDNGGHDQFYYNSTGIVWRNAQLGFEAIGVPEAAQIIKESAGRFGESPSLDRDLRHQQMSGTAVEFGDLDTRFYALQKVVNIEQAMKEYISQHREQFCFDGMVSKLV